ncbi:uncharacterized protein BN794_00576 [Coprobacillus sp. CAG:826]|nr:uncharacterized protein BN794_00576 [Coprobacillus sp. CAG:826]
MKRKGIERNKLDYILTDLLPYEVSELFSFSQLYNFLLEKKNKKTIDNLIKDLKLQQSRNNIILFKSGWCTKPLKYKILKGNNSMREMSIIQPFSALNLFLFIECYQKDILSYFEKYHSFSIRYYRKSSNLYYFSKNGKITQYFQKQISSLSQGVYQNVSNFFKVGPFESINAFTDSQIWRMSNFEFKYYAHLDYKSCFDSIYTHAFTWIIERNTIDAKSANNSYLFITIDRILQNINGRSSNGIVVGPEFSRMIAEILLEHIDKEILLSLEKENIFYNNDYVAFRYVDDIFIFTKQAQTLEQILSKYKSIGEQYLLRLNELKLIKGITPCLPKEWLEKTRQLADIIGSLFNRVKRNKHNNPPEGFFIVKNEFVFIDRIKDEIAVLMTKHLDDCRTIVSFLLSTLLKNISIKKEGFTLFESKESNNAMKLLDLALYIYAFYPSFDQTRKVISIIAYLNSEIDFKTNNKKINQSFNKYAFIFQSGNLFDLCDWFPFFCEYNIKLDTKTEKIIVNNAKAFNDPIIWANILLYSRYNKIFFKEILKVVSEIINKKISKISNDEPMMQEEFWYVLIFHNCPYISKNLHAKIQKIISFLKPKKISSPSDHVSKLIFDFLEQKDSNGIKSVNSLFNWKGINNFSDFITYRTYQRTIFKRYGRNKYGLNTSVD